MTVAQIAQKIEKRGFMVSLNPDGTSFTVLDAKGNAVPWVTFSVGPSGKINNTALRSYHPPKISGQNEHETVVIYADLYLMAAGHPAQADKAIVALLANDAVQAIVAPTATVLQQSAVLATV